MVEVVFGKSCVVCKSVSGYLHKYRGKYFRKRQGVFYHDMICRGCNTKRMKEYRKTVTGRKNVNNAVYRYNKKNKAKVFARHIVNYNLKVGNISRGICSCGSISTEAHHKNYKKPLEVIWLCRPCHSNLHRKVIIQ